MKFPQQGGCLCGAVRYELRQAPVRSWTCHCTLCQRITGAAFSLAVAVPAEGFELLQGDLRSLGATGDSGRVWTRWICTRCETPVCLGSDPRLAPTRPHRSVLGGSLDDSSWLRPTTHYWTRTKQPWVALPVGDTIHETQDY